MNNESSTYMAVQICSIN